MGFIYKVTNQINGKSYIGKTAETIQKRWNQHLNTFYSNNFKNRPLYSAFNKYGINNFKIEQIEEVSNSFLSEREQYWIQYYHTYVKDPQGGGYNATLGGDGTFKYDYKAVIQDYLKTQSKKQTMKNLNCSLDVVNNAMKEYNISTINKSAGREIVRIDPITREEKTFPSIKKASEELAINLNKDPNTIRKRITSIINHKQDQKGYGYYWKIAS